MDDDSFWEAAAEHEITSQNNSPAPAADASDDDAQNEDSFDDDDAQNENSFDWDAFEEEAAADALKQTALEADRGDAEPDPSAEVHKQTAVEEQMELAERLLRSIVNPDAARRSLAALWAPAAARGVETEWLISVLHELAEKIDADDTRFEKICETRTSQIVDLAAKIINLPQARVVKLLAEIVSPPEVPRSPLRAIAPQPAKRSALAPIFRKSPARQAPPAPADLSPVARAPTPAESSDDDDDDDDDALSESSENDEVLDETGEDRFGRADLGDASQVERLLSQPASSQAPESQPAIALTGCAADSRVADLKEKVNVILEGIAAAGRAAEVKKRVGQAPRPAIHQRGSERARELFDQAQFLPPSEADLALLPRDARAAVRTLPDLSRELRDRLDVIDLEDYVAHDRFAKRLLDEALTPEAARDLGFRVLSDSTLVVSSDARGRRKRNEGRSKDEPAVRAIAVWLSHEEEALAVAFGKRKLGERSVEQAAVLRQVEGASRYCYPVREGQKHHAGDMYGEGARFQRIPAKTHNQIHTYRHKSDDWLRDDQYPKDVALNAAKVCALETFVAPRLARIRLEFRKAVDLPGLHEDLGDAVSGPAVFISRGYASPMHCDRTAAQFSEAIVWVAGKIRVDWQFAIPSASIAFSIDRAAPCFCLLQAADVVHGTLHTGVKHDGVGIAIVSRDVLSTRECQDKVRRSKKRARP